MNTKPFLLNFWVFVFMSVTMLAMAGENIYLSTVVSSQRHTILQYMGQELGPHDTPRPPLKPQVGQPMWDKDPVRQEYRRQLRSI